MSRVFHLYIIFKWAMHLYVVMPMVRKMNEADRHFLVFDEDDETGRKMLAAVDDAQAKNLYEYLLVGPKSFYVIQNGLINSSGRPGYALMDAEIDRILKRMGKEMPKAIYHCYE